MMPHLKQALLCYWRWITSHWSIFVAAVFLVPLFMAVALLAPPRGGEQYMMLILAMFPAATVAAQLKRQIILVHERRLPSALAAHIIAGLALILLFAFGPVTAKLLLGQTITATHFGVAAMVLAVILWSVATETWYFFGVWFIPFYLIQRIQQTNPTIGRWLAGFTQGEYDGVGMAMFATGIAASAWAISYLARITEEDTGYFSRIQTKNWFESFQQSVKSGGNEAQKKIWQNWWIRFSDPKKAAIARWPNWAQGPLWQRIRLYLVGDGWRSPIYFHFIGVLGGLLMVWLMGGWMMLRTIGVIMPFYTMLPAVVIVFNADQQRLFWPVELLRPASRPQYIAEKGMSLMFRVAAGWTLMATFCIALLFVASKSPDDQILQTKKILLTGGLQAVLFGIMALVLKHKTRPVIYLTFFTVMPAAIAMGIALQNSPPSWTTLATMIAAMFAVGAAITYAAYRSWLNAEFG